MIFGSWNTIIIITIIVNSRDKVLLGIFSKSNEIISSSPSPSPEVLSPKWCISPLNPFLLLSLIDSMDYIDLLIIIEASKPKV